MACPSRVRCGWMITLTNKLGAPVHHSLVLRKAKGSGLHDASALIGLAIARGCWHYQGGPEPVLGAPLPRAAFSAGNSPSPCSLPACPTACGPCAWAHRCSAAAAIGQSNWRCWRAKSGPKASCDTLPPTGSKPNRGNPSGRNCSRRCRQLLRAALTSRLACCCTDTMSLAL